MADVCRGQRFFPDHPADLQALMASVAHPDAPYGPAPGHLECHMCGSPNVVADASATWNTEAHGWEMSDPVGSHFTCEACDHACKVDWVSYDHRVQAAALTD